MRCTFCATGKGGFARNLRPHEIVDQVLTVQEHFGTRVSNVGAPPQPLFIYRSSKTFATKTCHLACGTGALAYTIELSIIGI